MKVFSILYESRLNPGRISLFTAVAETGEEASRMGLDACNAQFGEILWEPRLANNITIGTLESPVKTQELTIEHDKNWLMKTILDSKDKKLFKAVRSYLSENEVTLIKEQLK